MKNRFKISALLTAFMAVSLCASAQNLRMIQTGFVTHPDGSREYAIPSTELVADITVRKESFVKGPYARYAQRYFGAIALPTDRTVYEITAAGLGWRDNACPPQPCVAEPAAAQPASELSPITPSGEFPRVLPDQTSMTNKTLEDAAMNAARTIFDIRKRRLELVSGDYAETVFGAGLQTALDRLDRIEAEYLELFYGKLFVSYETVRRTIIPESGRTTYIVCRWSESGGILSDSDLSGEPVVLELRPQNMASRASTAASNAADIKKSKKQDAPETEFAVADNVACRLLLGKTELAARTVPIFQFGVKVMQ